VKCVLPLGHCTFPVVYRRLVQSRPQRVKLGKARQHRRLRPQRLYRGPPIAITLAAFFDLLTRLTSHMPDRSAVDRSHPSRTPCLTAVLRMAGLRPTRQRVALAELLFGGPHRHVSAEQLHGEASSANVNVS